MAEYIAKGDNHFHSLTKSSGGFRHLHDVEDLTNKNTSSLHFYEKIMVKNCFVLIK